MIGEKIGMINADTATKTLPAVNGVPVLETSTQGSGTLYGIDVQSMATYQAMLNKDGSWQGECPNQGVIMAADGVATFSATGVGHMTDNGGNKFRGAVYFHTEALSLAKLNGTCFIYEWDVGADGQAVWNIWEWK